MDKLTPGRKLILDLLAKSVAKIQAAEAANKVKVEHVKIDGMKGKMKRESMEVPVKLRKKIKAEKNIKEIEELKIIPEIDTVKKTEHGINMDKKEKSLKKENKVYLRKENEIYKEDKLGIKEKEPKTEVLKIIGMEEKSKNNKKNKENVCVEATHIPVKIKSEYTEMKTEEIDLKSYVKPEIKGNKLTISNISSIVKNENNKASIKIEDISDAAKSKDVQKKEPVKQSLKKEYLRLESDLSLLEGETSTAKNKLNVHEEVLKENGDKGQKRRFKKITSRKKFSPEEDQIILDAIEKSGDKIDILQIAEDLQRTELSVLHEVRKLKSGKENKRIRKRLFTLSEDTMILDAVLQNLSGESLEVVNLTQIEWRKVGAQLGKEAESLRTRWARQLRPWILQHFAGTLNLQIRRSLSNYVADNFTDVNSIDWPSVSEKPEFAGHTSTSLKGIFSQLIQLAKKSLHKNCEDITLEMVSELANTKYAAGERKVLDRDLKRQQEIIEHFECYVKTNCIKDFL